MRFTSTAECCCWHAADDNVVYNDTPALHRPGNNLRSSKNTFAWDVGEMRWGVWNRHQHYLGVHGIIQLLLQMFVPACMLLTLVHFQTSSRDIPHIFPSQLGFFLMLVWMLTCYIVAMAHLHMVVSGWGWRGWRRSSAASTTSRRCPCSPVTRTGSPHDKPAAVRTKLLYNALLCYRIFYSWPHLYSLRLNRWHMQCILCWQ